MIPFLGPLDPFPPVTEARQEMNGLLAVGGLLLPDRLLDAYRRGIFPWGTVEGQALWYSPDPRMVMFPENFRLSRSLRRLLRSDTLTISADRDFPAVIAACAATRRRGQDGTWISNEMMEAYIRLHELGWAHSVEAWEEGELVGGLYGLAIGRMFYGESMFSRRDNASKFAFAYLIRLLRERGFGMIDCQMHTDHLASLGAAEIPRSEFLQHMRALIGQGERSVWQLAVTTDW
ncbi:leucyl/phenylalanyl-tRNA--protein transferase [Azonexus hydrophilus]|uniref:leucyl/phenylalanyl-tRNA--protein transferase n=1 Tax=Azonexus hydrophilus TaxID=418702 RepID=UPI00040D2451|nr:leucyl/phenylalanyl-tRNA--protein transferase [Azonexus hydrophilus]